MQAKVGLIALLMICAPAWANPITALNQRIDKLHGRGAHQQYQAFFLHLQQVIKHNDSHRLLQMINYPFTTKIAGKTVQFCNAKQLQKQLDPLFSREIRQVYGQQKYAELFINYRGAMMGNGELWFAQTCRDEDCQAVQTKIIAINQ